MPRKTVDGKRSGLGEVRDRHDESDFGAEKTSTSSRTIWIGVGGFAGALLLLVVILVVFHILRKKGVIGHRRKGRHSGRHGAVAERIQPVKEWGAESETRIMSIRIPLQRKIQNPFRKHPVKGAMLKP